MKTRHYILAALIAAVFQTGALAKMIVDRNRLLTNGVEVTLETGFIDPRDLFRGHYVILELEISRFPVGSVPEPAKQPDLFTPVWVALKPGDGLFWQVAGLYLEPPSDGVALKGQYRHSSSGSHFVEFPVDRFFAPELRAKELETIRRDRKLGAILSIAPSGEAAIKGITVDGEPVYVEPLF